MENKKFKITYVEGEDGKPKRKFVPYEEEAIEPDYALYGDYMLTDAGSVEHAKKILLEHMFDAIKEIAKNDKFWIIKTTNQADQVTVAWKIHFPQMENLTGATEIEGVKL